MKIYAFIIEDRHEDIQIKLFKSAQTAIRKAEEYLAKSPRVNPDYDFEADYGDWKPSEDCLFFRVYNGEGDCVKVQVLELED